MLNLSTNTQIYLCTAPTDMRKSFDGLSALVTSVINKDLLSGHLFLFLNRRRDRIKLMYWDRDGLAIWYKRLEAGTFETPGRCRSISSGTRRHAVRLVAQRRVLGQRETSQAI